MSETLATLAQRVQGEVRGNAETVIAGAAALETAGPQDLSFVQDRSQWSRLATCRAAALVVSAADADVPAVQAFPRIVVDHPQAAFVTLLTHLRPPRPRPPRGISAHAWISPTAQIGADCYIGPGATIGDDVRIGDGCDIYPGVVVGDGCQIGRDVVLYPHAVLYADVSVGDRAIIHAQAVIGADGFGYRFADGRFHKIPQLGTVQIQADVEIGAGATVDRGAIGPTVVGEGTKIDNMVMIAHNCEIGRHNVFASQVGLAGSCVTGDYVRLGGQVGVKDHVRLNTGCSVGAKGGVHKDIPPGEAWIGYPATPEAEQKRLVFSLKRVPEMREQVKALEQRLAQLTAEVAALKGPQAGDPSSRAA